LLASLGSKGKNRNSLACLRNAGFHFAESYCNNTYSIIPLATAGLRLYESKFGRRRRRRRRRRRFY